MDLGAVRDALIKTISAAVASSVVPEPITASSLLSATIPAIVDAALSLGKKQALPLEARSWVIVRAAFAAAIARFLVVVDVKNRPSGEQLRVFIESLLNRADLLAVDRPQFLTADHFSNPLLITVVRDFSAKIPHALGPFNLSMAPDDARQLFESCMFEGFSDVRNAKSEMFSDVDKALTGALARAAELRAATSRHYQFLIRGFTQRSIFGQETSGITLSDLYVRQRCIWRIEGERQGGDDASRYQPNRKRDDTDNHVLALGDLHRTVAEWLGTTDRKDHVRVVAGGPGSGKSTFARALAIEVADSGTYDVIFLPLQELDPTGNFETRVSRLLKVRSELGFDRVASPLDWMGQSGIEGDAPARPLLLVCDGLDELAAPDTKDAANVTAEFIQTMNNWMSHRNSGGCMVRAVILGRTIAAEEAFGRLDIDSHALLRVAGLLPLANNQEWETLKRDERVRDPGELASFDQREIYWRNWCRANYLDDSELPTALRSRPSREAVGSGDFVELTSEPLLLYLLIWTGFLGPRWHEASANRNVVYLEMFKRIFSRDWGDRQSASDRRNEPESGHSALAAVGRDDFFALQECLGLASWASGGRMVSAAAFEIIREHYLTEDEAEHLTPLLQSSLKSVALQSYTRSVAGGDEGYEFVHKTLGEYLIARALVRTCERAIESMSGRSTDSRAKGAASLSARICSIGPLTQEIDRFFRDEVRLRSQSIQSSRGKLERSAVPLINWLIRHGPPVHEAMEDARKLSYSLLARAAVRTQDVIWSYSQHLAQHAYPIDSFQIGTADEWEWAPLEIKWPQRNSFSSLVSMLTDRTHVAETHRIPAFSYLDLTKQAVTEQDFGSIIYEDNDNAPRPLRWLPISFIGCNVSGAQFYMAHLRSGNFSYAKCDGAELSQAALTDAVFFRTRLVGAKIRHARLVRASFRGADLSRAALLFSSLRDIDFDDATMTDTVFGQSEIMSRSKSENVHYNGIYKCTFRRVSGLSIDFGRVPIVDCDFSGADLRNSDFSRAELIRCVFDGANLEGTRFSQLAASSTILSEAQRHKIIITVDDFEGAPSNQLSIVVDDD